MRRVPNSIAALLIAAVLFVVMALPAWAAGSAMTLTFVRHGQSTANEAGVLNTAVPGPGLTALGRQQARNVAAALAAAGHDGIYASTMLRTQQTATPLGTATVLPGLHEIDAGIFEGTAERGPLALLGYGGPPLLWTFGLRAVPILGSKDTGNAFDARVDGAVKTIYDTGERNPVVFSHGATIMFWVMMNVDNPDPLLILTHPLGNTDAVTVTGAPDTGWTLTDWDGVRVDPDPSPLTRLFVAVRDVVAGLYGGARSTPAPTAPVTTLTREGAAPAASSAEPKSDPAAAPTKSHKATRPERDAQADAVEVESKHSSVAPNGATDLSDGNLVRPGSTVSKPAAVDSDQAEPATAPTTVEAPPVADQQKTASGADTADAVPAAA